MPNNDDDDDVWMVFLLNLLYVSAMGSHALAAAGPRAWNSLPDSVLSLHHLMPSNDC